jgi:hypothetical protein
MRMILWSVLAAALLILGIMLTHGANAQSSSNCFQYGAGVRCESRSSSTSSSSSSTTCFQNGANTRCETRNSNGQSTTTTCFQNGAMVRCNTQ